MTYTTKAVTKPTPEYCYIACEECGSRELANLGNHHCIVCHWRLTGELPTGAKPGIQGLREACAEAERSAQAFLQKVLGDLLEAGYSARDIERVYSNL